MNLSLVGTRFTEGELSRLGRLLFVRIDLPEGAIEAVVKLVTHDRVGSELKRKWSLGVKVHQMSDDDTQRLEEYLEKLATGQPVIISD